MTNELWIVNALITGIEVDDDGVYRRVCVADPDAGVLGYFPVYSTKKAALADHPRIADMDTTGQANHLRCVTLD